MDGPVVTVICVCYNHGPFVREAIYSVLAQTHRPVQLIVVDDGSRDNSVDVIGNCVLENPAIEFLPLHVNTGYCKAFNQALASAKGDYIIDFSGDDVLLPERISKGVAALNEAGDRYGVHFTDAFWIREDGSVLYQHSQRFPHETMPQGNIYRDLVERFFICSPTMMFRRKVIESLGGYDETLSYEDFDFWIRSSRSFFYCYTPEVLVKKRVVRDSMSHNQFKMLSPQLASTYKVCEKIMALNRSAAEQTALAKRIRYEMRVSLRLMQLPLVWRYALLYRRNRRLRYERKE